MTAINFKHLKNSKGDFTVKWLFFVMIVLQNTVYCITPGLYVGLHQGYGVLEDTLGKTHQISGSRFGLLEKNLLGMWTFHYQYPEKWGITTIMSSQFSPPYDTKKVCYHAYMGSVVAKRELFKSSRSPHVYFPIGGWCALSEAVPRAKSNPAPHYIYGIGIVFGGFGYQLGFDRILLDVAYKRLWSFYRMNHTGVWTISLGLWHG
jgi:hypothetical protein